MDGFCDVSFCKGHADAPFKLIKVSEGWITLNENHEICQELSKLSYIALLGSQRQDLFGIQFFGQFYERKNLSTNFRILYSGVTGSLISASSSGDSI